MTFPFNPKFGFSSRTEAREKISRKEDKAIGLCFDHAMLCSVE